MQEEADVFEQVEGSRRCGTLVHLLLVFGLMGVDALQNTQPPEGQQDQGEVRTSQWVSSCLLDNTVAGEEPWNQMIHVLSLSGCSSHAPG